MRSRSTLTAALALAAATILAVAACGSSVSGSAQANTSAAATMTEATATSAPETQTTEADTTVAMTDASALTSLLSDLPTDLSLPSDLTIPTDLTLPTDFSVPSDLSELTNLTNLDIPGLAPGCLEVASAYASLSLALLPALFGGSEGFNAGDLQKSLGELSAKVPPELAPDIKVLTDAAAAANGKSLTEAADLFNSSEFTAAQNNIDQWLNTNCNG
jgi:hypothetical protein